jgi:asparagine synthase (glutamine-hydrolysing)
MCGWVFAVGKQRFDADMDRMRDRLQHRGPDDASSALLLDNRVYFGFRRLSIIDLSDAAQQPMWSRSGRYLLLFNGEIYNYKFLPRYEAGVGDSRALLETIADLGLEPTLRMARGMFSFVLFDKQERVAYLVRDRFGEKPLYYGMSGGDLFAASDLSVFLNRPGHPRPVLNIDALSLFMRFGYVPHPLAILEGVYKLPPGHFLRLPLIDFLAGGTFALKPFPDEADSGTPRRWAAKVEDSATTIVPRSDEQAIEALVDALTASVRSQLTADVPVGALLSGGIDSSLICSLARREFGPDLHTFTIGTLDPRGSEAPYATRVAEHLKTRHFTHVVTSDEISEVGRNIAAIYTEPFADSSAIPTCLVSRLARSHVKVALGGDGGDEMFAGYVRHFTIDRLRRMVDATPSWLRRRLGDFITGRSIEDWDGLRSQVGKVIPQFAKPTSFGARMHKVAELLRAPDTQQAYLSLSSIWNEVPLTYGTGPCADRVLSDYIIPYGFLTSDEIARRDSMTYLPGDILHKTDRASMYYSLELRSPYLDARVVAFANALPAHFKIRSHSGKWILRAALERYLPKALFERPKTGFGIPLGAVLRDQLRGWANELLDNDRLQQQGVWDVREVDAAWRQHKEGTQDWAARLWPILVLQSWLDLRGMTLPKNVLSGTRTTA